MATTIYVDETYTQESVGEGWGTIYFSSYKAAVKYADEQFEKNNSEFVIYVKNDNVAYNSDVVIDSDVDDNWINKKGNSTTQTATKIDTVITSGSRLDLMNNKIDLTYDLTVEAGATLKTTRGNMTEMHVKADGNLIAQGTKDNRATVYLFNGTNYTKGYDVLTTYGSGNAGKILMTYTDFTCRDLSLNSGTGTFTGCNLTIRGALNAAAEMKLTDSTVTVFGQYGHTSQYFTNYNNLGSVVMNDSIMTIGDNDASTQANEIIFKTVTLENNSTITVKEGGVAKLTKNITATDSTLNFDEANLFQSSVSVSKWSLPSNTYYAILLDNEGNEVQRSYEFSKKTSVSYTFAPVLAGTYTAVIRNSSGADVYTQEKTVSYSGTAALNLTRSQATAAKFNVYNGKITMDDSTLTVDTLNITEMGSIVMDVDSTIKFNALSCAGTITVDASAYQSGTYTILDYTGTGAGYTEADYKAMLGTSWSDKFVVLGGDLMLTDADRSTIYVNSAWSETAPEDLLLGYNAFSSSKAALEAANANGGASIVLEKIGMETTNQTVGTVGISNSGTYSISGGSGKDSLLYGFSTSGTGVNVEIKDAYLRVSKHYFNAKNSTLTVNNSVIGTAPFGGHNDGWFTASHTAMSINNSILGIEFANYTDEQIAAMARSASDVKEAGSYWQFGCNNSGPHIGTANTISAVNSTISTGWLSLVDRAMMTLDNSVLYYGGGIAIGAAQVDASYGKYNSNEQGWDCQLWWSPVLSSAAGYREGEAATVTITNSIVRNIGAGNGTEGAHVQVGGSYCNYKNESGECAGVLNIINSEFSTTPVDANGNAIAQDYDLLVVKGNGTVNVDDSTVITGKLVVEAGGSVKVDGDSTLNIGDLAGFIEVTGGSLTDSKVLGGAVAFTGDTALKGANEFNHFWVSGGTLTVEGDLVSANPYPGFFAVGNNQDVNAVELNYFAGFNGTESGALVINGTFSAEEGVVSEGGQLVVNGIMNANGLYLRGGETIVNAEAALGNIVWGSVDADATLSVNGGTLTTRKADGSGSFSNAGSFNLTNGSLNSGTAFVNTGVFNINNSSVYALSLNNTGIINITIDTENVNLAEGYKLIDVENASNFGTYNVFSADDLTGCEYLTINNDLYIVDMSTIYVSSAYAAMAEGTVIAGKGIVGGNLFGSFDKFNASAYSAGDRTVVYTFDGSVAGQKITVANDPGTTGVQYSFEGTGVSFSNGSRTHTITEAGVYTFDFAKGDYNFAIEEFVGNTTVALPDAADVAVSKIVGDQEFTFSVADNTTGTFACNFSGVSGAFRVTIYRGTEEVASKLFNAAGSYSVDDLAAGEYSVVFSAYGNNSAGAQLTADFDLTSAAVPATGDIYSTLDNTSDGSIVAAYAADLTLENWVGTEDKIDWFQIEDVTAGTHSFNFELEGNNLAVVIYDANLKTLSSFTVTDKVADGVDFTRSLKLAAETDLFVKVTGRGADSDYSISIA